MIYNFRNKITGEIFKLEMMMADRVPYLETNLDMEQILISPPKIADPFLLGRLDQNTKDFNKHVIGRMKHSIPGNNLKNSRFGSSVEI